MGLLSGVWWGGRVSYTVKGEVRSSSNCAIVHQLSYLILHCSLGTRRSLGTIELQQLCTCVVIHTVQGTSHMKTACYSLYCVLMQWAECSEHYIVHQSPICSLMIRLHITCTRCMLGCILDHKMHCRTIYCNLQYIAYCLLLVLHDVRTYIYTFPPFLVHWQCHCVLHRVFFHCIFGVFCSAWCIINYVATEYWSKVFPYSAATLGGGWEGVTRHTTPPVQSWTIQLNVVQKSESDQQFFWYIS